MFYINKKEGDLMPVHLVYKDEIVKANLIGEIDDHCAASLRENIDESILRLRPKKLFLDFSKVPFMDSSGIGLIIGRYRLMRMWKGEVILSGMSKRIEMIVKLSGADKIVTMERRDQSAG